MVLYKDESSIFLAVVVLHGILKYDAVQGPGLLVQPAVDMRKFLDVSFRCDHAAASIAISRALCSQRQRRFLLLRRTAVRRLVVWCTCVPRDIACVWKGLYDSSPLTCEATLEQGALEQFASSVVSVCLPQSSKNQAINGPAVHTIYFVFFMPWSLKSSRHDFSPTSRIRGNTELLVEQE